MKKLKAKIKALLPRLKHTCRNLSVHGPTYLTRKDVHVAYRFIYFIIYVHVWIAAVAAIYKYVSAYREDTIRFTTRTDYLDWNTTFPSITICQIGNNEKILQQLQNTDNEERLNFVKQIAFFRGDCPSCTWHNKTEYSTDLARLTSVYRSECKDLFITCTWDNKPVNCCQHFKPVQTEYGLCFSMNNIQFHEQFSYYVASSDRRHLGSLSVALSEDYEAFLHAREDVPFWNMEQDRRISVGYGMEATVSFSIVDIMNEPEVTFTVPNVRQCRFPSEVPSNFRGFSYYSYSVCIVECRIHEQLNLCGCTSHLSPLEYKDKYCDLEGLQCLIRYNDRLKRLRVPKVNETGLQCDCLPSCTEPDYNIIAKKLSLSDKPGGAISFILGNRPYERVTRQLAHTTLDLVVAVGNCFGLGFGGSILSIVEFMYYICFKQWKYTNVDN
ncbi:unnamed protein product [Pieris macdunnoughi]|uniref:Uncharacterized protein n=1 Tax=Pieris macdunnoughi TaxID=345717 RepID=A0A821UZD6_9NEOP|nr:unnamed protein product [Pieris macdunnoughi]